MSSGAFGARFEAMVDVIRLGWGSGTEEGQRQAAEHVNELILALDLHEARALLAYAAAYVAGREHAEIPKEPDL